MYFASNLQHLRKSRSMTQEKLAQQLGVTRQAISKWESGETIPELPTLLRLTELFSCTLDALLQQELTPSDSPVRLVRVKGFSMVRYRMISPNARSDLLTLLTGWAHRQGIENPTLLLWGFPHITEEQKKRFSMESFEAACLLQEASYPTDDIYPVTFQPDCTYAVLTITEPNGRSNEQIARAIRTILGFLQERGIRKAAREGFLPCFERRYCRDGVQYADLFLQCQDTENAEEYTLK